jgi:membrane-bound lytic murein transglycosylase B
MAQAGATGNEQRKPAWVFPFLFALFTLPGAPARAVELDDYPRLQLFMDEMASRHDFDLKQLARWFADAEIRDDILDAIRRPKENLPWHEYRPLFVNDERRRPGLAFWRAHAETLARAEVEYGVPAEIIVSILGVETRYGRQTGRYRAFDALTTLMLRYPERSDFFRNELAEFLLLSRELGVSPLGIKGSYAGALGAPQFMPSSYRHYAVDFSGDRRRDLLNNIEDTIGSVANFLKQHGWQRDEPIVGEVQLEGSMYSWLENNGTEPRISIKYLSRYGIRPVIDTGPRELAALVRLEGEAGPVYRLGYNNFYVITRYNRSKNYAMAVVELAQDLRRLYDGE